MAVNINLLAHYWQQRRHQQVRKLLGLSGVIISLFCAFGFYWQQQRLKHRQFQQQVQILQQQITDLTASTELPKPAEPIIVKDNPLPLGTISLQQVQIDVREVLQHIAASAQMNLVLHENVQGTVAVNFLQLPWQQALEVIIELANLVLEQQHNVLLVRAAPDAAQRLATELQQQQQQDELLPLESLLITVRYAKAIDLAALLEKSDQEWLSKRGTMSVDERTNTLVIRDISANLPYLQQMVQQLDVPVRQVAIEARILNVQESFSEELGILWEISTDTETAAVATLSNDILINLELQALENEHLVEELAHPRLITADQQTAIIRQGEEIPYQQSAEYGASTISFKPAVLELQVTPHITPDNQVILKLVVKNDTRGAQALAENVPIITTKEIRTEVLVRDGQTIALGGIYTIGKSQQEERVPVLGKIPGLGKLFTYKSELDERKQLLVLVRPKIIVE